MAIIDTQKTDYLWKKVVYGATDTTITGKQGYEEAIGSRPTILASDIWSFPVPTPAPNVTGNTVQYFSRYISGNPINTSPALKFTVDSTVAGNKTWLATTTFGDVSTRVGDWVPPSIDSGYLAQIYNNDPTVGGNLLNQGTSTYEWVFDYSAGVLQFVNTLPAGITTLWLVAHRYVGLKGLQGAGVPEADIEYTYSGSTVSSGTHSITNFFAHIPQTNTVTIMFNGVRIDYTDWNNSGTTLNLNMNNIPYPLEDGDIISSRYAWAA